MTTETKVDLPNFAAVTLDEAIAWADSQIEPRRPLLSEWIAQTNTDRAQAQIEFEAQPVQIAGIMLQPSDCANLSIQDHWSHKRTRKLNCTITGQAITRPGYGAPQLVLRFVQWGAKPDPSGYHSGRPLSVQSAYIVAAEKVETPDWISKTIAERKERGY